MRISAIAAVAANGVIGRNNGLPWRLSTDLKQFKKLTMGHHMVMGRKTWESVGVPLPGRPIVVISRRDFPVPAGVSVVHSFDDAIRLAGDDEEVFIAGGGEIYAQYLHRFDRMYITRVHAEVEGDALFPEFDDVNEWRLVDREDFEADDRNDHPFSFLTYDRIGHIERQPVEDEEQG